MASKAGAPCRHLSGFSPSVLFEASFSATTGLAATVSPSTVFPVSPVIRSALLPRFPGRTRTVSPVAQQALVTVLPLHPAEGTRRFSPSAPRPAAFARPERARPSDSLHATQATGFRLLPRWDCLPLNMPAFAGRTMARKLGIETIRGSLRPVSPFGPFGIPVVSQCAPTAQITSGRRIHPCSCR
jgi:hypothetical protein